MMQVENGLARDPAAMPYLPQLDGVRAISVLIVFVSHCGFGDIVPGGFGVTVFFFLSGYLITTLLRIERARTGRVDLRAFYVRRSLRILPPMYVALALTGLLYGLGLLRWFEVDTVAVLGQLTFLTNYPDFLGTERVLPVPLWSLAIEEHFYLVFPLCFVLWLGARSPRKAAIACLIACIVVLGIRYANVWRLADFSWNYSWTHTRIDAILFGCCLGFWNNPVMPSDEAWRPRAWAVVAAASVIVASLMVRDEAFRQTLRYTLQSAALFVLFAGLVHGRGRVVRWLTAEPIRRLGLYSYGFYLTHMVVVALVQHVLPEIGRLTLVFVAFWPSLLASWLMFVLVELPAANLRRCFLNQTEKASEPSVAGDQRLIEPVPMLRSAPR